MRHLQSLLACALLALAALACAWPALDKSSLFTAAGSTTADTPQQTATVSGQSLPEGWTAMPAGARSTYLGIHGGTVPVSLLVSRDGMSLVSFVGQTGNDFLELLRRADVRLPSLLTSILGSSHGGSMLLAGRAQRSMPVLYVLGDRLAAMPQGLQGLQPFGLSDKPLSIEGNIPAAIRRHGAIVCISIPAISTIATKGILPLRKGRIVVHCCECPVTVRRRGKRAL